MPNPDLIWVETKPGMWRSVDGKYVILRTVLPEDRPHPTAVYTLRKSDPAMACAHPGTLGYFRTERYSLQDAQQQAANDAYCDLHPDERSVPVDFPALALQRFFWPISEGITRGALVIVRDGDRTVARIVGMSRGEDAFEPGVYAEIDLSALSCEETS